MTRRPRVLWRKVLRVLLACVLLGAAGAVVGERADQAEIAAAHVLPGARPTLLSVRPAVARPARAEAPVDRCAPLPDGPDDDAVAPPPYLRNCALLL